MEFPLTEDERRFRDELREWLAEVVPPEGIYDWGPTPSLEDIPAAKAWQRQLADAGWAGLAWPKEFGGRESSVMEQAIFAEEVGRVGLPRQLNLVGPGLVGPMLIEHGTPEQRDRYLAALHRGDEVWCQLFSEPEAGSDLAGMKTQARLVDDKWRINGQKVWSSGAHYADFGLLLAVSEPDAKRYERLSVLLLPMGLDGISVRPIQQMDGGSNFNEVFFDDVVVASDALVGARGAGWRIAMSTLGVERSIHGTKTQQVVRHLRDMLPLLESLEGAEGLRARTRWTRLFARSEMIRMTWIRGLSEDPTGPIMSLIKVSVSELLGDVAAFATDLLGERLLLDSATSEYWRKRLLEAPGATIAAGTSEIQRNIVGERLLGLPR